MEWPSGGESPAIRHTAAFLADIAELVLSGYRRYPWGGAEVGGVLFGTRDSAGVCMYAVGAVECEHDHGPAFELSPKDFAGLERLLSAAPDGELKGLVPVGWNHSVSNRELALTDHDRRLHERFFPEPWQVSMILRRSKSGPLAIGFFQRNSAGSLEAHSLRREFAVEDFRLSATDVPLADLQLTVP